MSKTKSALADRYMENVELSTILPINKGLGSATEQTMISIFGAPHLPLTTSCQNKLASDLVAKNEVSKKICAHVSVTGIKAAVDSLDSIVKDILKDHSDLEDVLETQGMLCVRYRKPTSGKKSTKISNHSWGTAIDFNIHGYDAPGNTGRFVPKFIAIMVPYFNARGWFSGIAFHDTMHFEVSEQTIRSWSESSQI